jgi:hypothetical protein
VLYIVCAVNHNLLLQKRQEISTKYLKSSYELRRRVVWLKAVLFSKDRYKLRRRKSHNIQLPDRPGANMTHSNPVIKNTMELSAGHIQHAK